MHPSLETVTSRSTENIAQRGHHALGCLDQIREGKERVAKNEFTFIRAIENIRVELAQLNEQSSSSSMS